MSENILMICKLNVTSLPEYFLQPFCNVNVWHLMEKAIVFELRGQPEFTVCAKYNVSVKNLNVRNMFCKRNGVDWWKHALERLSSTMPGDTCIICGLTRCVKEPTVHFHHFPTDPLVRSRWLRLLKLEESKVQAFSKICSKHNHSWH